MSRFLSPLAALFVWVAFCAIPASAFDVSVKANVDNAQVFVGDMFNYEIQVTAPENAIVDLPSFVGNLGSFEVKEMKFRPKIDTGDYETKKNHIMRFLKKGARVKVTIMFRGREMAHPEQGLNVLEQLAEDLKPYATVEQQPKMEGRNMHMLVAPIKGAFDKMPESDAE